MSYRVVGEAHGDLFNESGFVTEQEATDFASAVIDGDTDSTIRIEKVTPIQIGSADAWLGSRPQPFPGTAEEKRANLDSHIYAGDPGDERCVNCDCRPSYVSAGWPCGSDVPREVF